MDSKQRPMAQPNPPRYQHTSTLPAPQQTGGGWNPNQQPEHPQQPMGTYNPGFAQQAPQGYDQHGYEQPGYKQFTPQPQPGVVLVPQPMYANNATKEYCPITPDHRHRTKSERGGMGVIIAVIGCIFCLPCFLVTIPMDTKVTCRECYYVLKEGWGGM